MSKPFRVRLSSSGRALLLAVSLAAGVLLVGGGGLHAAHAQGGEKTILPGYWEYTSDYPGGKSTERRCLLGEEIDRFVAAPGNHRYRCTYPEHSLGGGHAHYRGVCASKHHSFPVTLDGTYSPTTLDLEGLIRPIPAMPLDIPASIKGRRLSATCPTGEASAH